MSDDQEENYYEDESDEETPKAGRTSKYKLSKQQMIARMRDIIYEYGSMKLTVRQLYYQMVARQFIPNSIQSYKRMAKICADARKDRQIRFEAIEDRTREVSVSETEDIGARRHFELYKGYMKSMHELYEIPFWLYQPKVPIVFVEKEALAGVFEPVCTEFEVDLIACRGYTSLSLDYELSKRMETIKKRGQTPVGIYFGDYDPSGLGIQDNINKSLGETFGKTLSLNRKALTREQVDMYDIPPAPAKLTDSRYNKMVETEGEAMQVELDALDPTTLQKMIRESIEKYLDPIAKRKRDDELQRRRDIIKGLVDGIEWNDGEDDSDEDDDEDDDDGTEAECPECGDTYEVDEMVDHDGELYCEDCARDLGYKD